MFCKECGNQIPDAAEICMNCGVRTDNAPAQATGTPKSRVVYVLLGFFLGALGVHNFYAGYMGRGFAQLLVTIFTGWLVIPIFVVGLWVLVEICVVSRDSKGNKFA